MLSAGTEITLDSKRAFVSNLKVTRIYLIIFVYPFHLQHLPPMLHTLLPTHPVGGGKVFC